MCVEDRQDTMFLRKCIIFYCTRFGEKRTSKSKKNRLSLVRLVIQCFKNYLFDAIHDRTGHLNDMI